MVADAYPDHPAFHAPSKPIIQGLPTPPPFPPLPPSPLTLCPPPFMLPPHPSVRGCSLPPHPTPSWCAHVAIQGWVDGGSLTLLLLTPAHPFHPRFDTPQRLPASLSPYASPTYLLSRSLITPLMINCFLPPSHPAHFRLPTLRPPPRARTMQARVSKVQAATEAPLLFFPTPTLLPYTLLIPTLSMQARVKAKVAGGHRSLLTPSSPLSSSFQHPSATACFLSPFAPPHSPFHPPS